MPHVTIKLYAGRTEQQKAKLAEAVTRAVMSAIGSSEASISVGIEDVQPADWTEQVYRPDIAGKAATIYKKPGYEPD